MVGSELNALTISNLFSGSTEPSRRKYVTLPYVKTLALSKSGVVEKL